MSRPAPASAAARPYYPAQLVADELGLSFVDLMFMALDGRAVVLANLHGLAREQKIQERDVPWMETEAPTAPIPHGLAYVDDDVLRAVADGRPGHVEKAFGWTTAGEPRMVFFEPAIEVGAEAMIVLHAEVQRLRLEHAAGTPNDAGADLPAMVDILFEVLREDGHDPHALPGKRNDENNPVKRQARMRLLLDVVGVEDANIEAANAWFENQWRKSAREFGLKWAESPAKRK